MEQLIILGIMLALGSLFGKKKEKDQKNQQNQQPKNSPSQQWPAQPTQREMKQREPQRTNAAPVEKPRSLKDLSRSLFEDIQKEFQEIQQEVKEPEQPVKAQAPQSEIFYAEPKKPVKPASTPRPARQTGRGRLQEQSIMQEEEQILQEDLVPRTPQQIMQGIVYAEILGPPKSKR